MDTRNFTFMFYGFLAAWLALTALAIPPILTNTFVGMTEVDADVRDGPNLIADAAARAQRDDLAALSIATRQLLPDLGSALLHPALLATLVYRAGLPNVAATEPLKVAANGQVFVARREALIASNAFARARASRCEDVTAARTNARWPSCKAPMVGTRAILTRSLRQRAILARSSVRVRATSVIRRALQPAEFPL